LHDSLDDLKKKAYMTNVLQRATTISGNDIEQTQPDSNTDGGQYELIMRAAFSLDFSSMKKMIDNWNPADFWLPKKVMLESLWYPLTELRDGEDVETLFAKDLARLKNLIDSGVFNNEEGFIACVIYNVCKADIPRTYSYKKFQIAGIDSPGEIMASMVDKVDRIKAEPIPYGIHITQLIGNIDNDSFPESLRLVNYLVESGLLTAAKYINILNIEMWMKVFRHTVPLFPGVSVFYTLVYGHDKLSIVNGQEIAFLDDTDFSEKRNDVLVKILNAIDNDDTPGRFYQGLYLMAAELFPTVDEKIWIESFSRAVDKTLSAVDVSRLTVRDNIITFIGEGISNLKNNVFKKEILSIINKYIGRNPLILCHTLSWSMQFNEEFLKDKDVESIINKILFDYPLSKTFRLFQRINNDSCISNEIQIVIEDKIEKEGLEFAKSNNDSIEMLSYLLKEGKNIENLKVIILSSWDGNYWDCGISENGKSFSSKGHLHLEDFSDNIVYDEDELKDIIRNMKVNLQIIRECPSSHLFDNYTRRHVLELLIGMKRFLMKHSVKSKGNIEELHKEIDELQMSLSSGNSILEQLSSNNFNEAKNGIDMLHLLINRDTISHYHDEIIQLINSVIFKMKDTMAISLGFIRYLVDSFPSEMIPKYDNILKIMIKSCSDVDYQGLHLHKLKIQENVYAISNILKSESHESL
ncbi:MAG: hypothetical protein NC453_22815, partial [Muribaculum sp.]|nr:hypothetical protein [Muribaculum sp.]